MTSPAHSILDAMFSRPAEQGASLAFVALRGGDVVAERYGVQAATEFGPAEQIDANSTLLSWSMAKSITHAVVGLLVTDGLLDVDAPAPVGQWVGTSKGAITTLQLLEMRSGLRFVEDYVDEGTSNCIEMLFGSTDPSHAHYAAAQPLVEAPGSMFNYSSGTTNIIARIIGDIVSGAPGGDPAEREQAVTEYLHTRLFEPTGMSSATAKFDDAGDFVGSSYVYATASDFARFGELYLHDGVTQQGHGARILPVGWADHARTRSGHDDTSGLDYGRHWWLWPAFPGSYACHGFDGQFVVVLPDRDLVLAHLGKTPAAHNPGVLMWLARLAEHL
ncbi:MAG: serine hydrolase domain-containing protein [Ilumatobacter sp.]